MNILLEILGYTVIIVVVVAAIFFLIAILSGSEDQW